MRISDWSSDVCSSDLPGGEVGAFDVEADPVEAGCRARQHHRRPPSWSTQVSLVPPPWLELTTSEPSVSATRVRRSEEHTSELQSLMRISYAVFCLKNTNTQEYNRDIR